MLLHPGTCDIAFPWALRGDELVALVGSPAVLVLRVERRCDFRRPERHRWMRGGTLPDLDVLPLVERWLEERGKLQTVGEERHCYAWLALPVPACSITVGSWRRHGRPLH